jgi:hypothetical protein
VRICSFIFHRFANQSFSSSSPDGRLEPAKLNKKKHTVTTKKSTFLFAPSHIILGLLSNPLPTIVLFYFFWLSYEVSFYSTQTVLFSLKRSVQVDFQKAVYERKISYI